jgi:hypothetical protein
MQTLSQEVKAINLIAPVVQTSTTTGTGVDVEAYNDDALAIVDVGTVSGGSPSTVVTIMGSLLATPTTYDQTLTTFVAITATGLAAGRANLAGIKNVKAIATQTGAGNVPICVTLVVTPFIKGSSNNSLTAA